MSFISLSQAFARWQELAESIPTDDRPALAESWNNYTDSLTKDCELCALQYHFAPAWDDEMPGTGARYDALRDDREFILERMGVEMVATFVPFSQSRNKDEKEPSLNWRITIKRNGRDVLAGVDYMQGSGHCPAYKNPPKGGSALQHRAIAQECKTGMLSIVVPDGSVRASMKNTVPAPDLQDVLHSLLMDASAIDAGGFDSWCADLGYDSDSIKARAAYDACIETAVKLRAGFSNKELADLAELFQDF